MLRGRRLVVAHLDVLRVTLAFFHDPDAYRVVVCCELEAIAAESFVLRTSLAASESSRALL